MRIIRNITSLHCGTLPRRCCLPAALALAAALLGAAPGAEASERRCGWLQNPTPANWFLVDRDGSWLIGAQGGHQAKGLDGMPDFTGPEWVTTNVGSYGYGCACLTVEADRASMRILSIGAVRQQPLGTCRADRALPRP